MTIASTTTKQTMLGDGTTRSWPFTFRAWEDEVRVIVADAAGFEADVTALSSVTLDTGGAGGAVAYPANPLSPALPAGHRIVIMRAMDFVQETRLVNVTRFDPAVIENQLDRLIANDQQLQEQVGRALAVGVATDRDPATVVDEVFLARDRAETAATAAGNSQTAAAGHAATAHQDADNAADSAELAWKWAENPQGVPVMGTEYSAKHWAEEAANTVSGGISLASPAQKGLVPAGGAAGQVYRVNAAGSAYGWEDFPKVEFATTAETVAGTISGKATHPAGVKAAIDDAIDNLPVPSGIPSGCIVMWSGTTADIPTGWALCDGQNGTPNLQERFVLGGGTYVPHSTGGSYKTGATTLTVNQMPSHGHTIPWSMIRTSASNTEINVPTAYSSTATSSAGGNQPHDHDLIPPYYVLCYIMKQ